MTTEVVSAGKPPLPQQASPLATRPAKAGAGVSGAGASAFEQVQRTAATPVPGAALPAPARGLASAQATADAQVGAAVTAQAGALQPGDEQQTAAADREALEQAVAAVKDYVKIVERELDFEVDESTGRTLVRVLDPESGEVIRQVPPEAVVKAAEVLAEVTAESGPGVLSGLLLREEA